MGSAHTVEPYVAFLLINASPRLGYPFFCRLILSIQSSHHQKFNFIKWCILRFKKFSPIDEKHTNASYKQLKGNTKQDTSPEDNSQTSEASRAPRMGCPRRCFLTVCASVSLSVRGHFYTFRVLSLLLPAGGSLSLTPNFRDFEAAAATAASPGTAVLAACSFDSLGLQSLHGCRYRRGRRAGCSVPGAEDEALRR